MADVKWIKLATNIFDNRKIKMIESLPEGYAVIVVWLKLLCLAGNINDTGMIYFTKEIPYTDQMLATQFNMPLTTVQLAFKTFQQFGMIEIVDNVLHISNWEKYQNVEGMEKIREQNRKRVAEHRARKKQALLEESSRDSNVTVTQGNAIEGEEERRKKKEDKELDKEGEGKENSKESGTPPHPQQIIDLFNSICVSFPPVQFMTANRKQAIEETLNTYTIDHFKQCFEIAENSAFLKGENKRDWAATFDWLITEENMAKVLEGNYNDKKKDCGSFDTNEFFEAALRRSCREYVADGEAEKKTVKTAGEDDAIRERAERLKERLG